VGGGVLCFIMKIISWNVGLGGFDKRREVRHLVKEKQHFMYSRNKVVCFLYFYL